MRRNDSKKIGNLIEQYLGGSDLGVKLKEQRIIKAWPKILGNNIQQHTSKIFINKRTLYVYINSSVVKHQLLGLKNNIVNALNKEVKSNIIDRIVIKNG